MRKLFTLAFALLLSVYVAAQPDISLVPYLSGFTRPVDITHCGDNRLFIVEQDGFINVVDSAGNILPTLFLDIDNKVGSNGNEQGLLGLAFHPDYKQNGYFYVNYTNNSGHTVIARYSVNPADSNQALSGSEFIIKTINQPFSNHNGGQMAFGPDGYLYIGMGDGGSGGDPQNNGQTGTALLGKMLRIDVNNGTQYSIPADNPFLNSQDTMPEIWHFGLRNPWRWSFDRLTGDMWIGDVGQGNIEEINFQSGESNGGENWGWRCFEGTSTYNASGCQPLAFYDGPVVEHDHNDGYCSITGGKIYRGGKFAGLSGYYLYSDFCNPLIHSLYNDNGTFLTATLGNWPGAGISTFGEDAQGELYVADLYSGAVRKITDSSSCSPVAMISMNDTVSICDSITTISTPYNSTNSYQWFYNGNPVANGTESSLTVNQDGEYVVSVTSMITFCSATDTVYVELKGVPQTAIISNLSNFYCVYNPVASLTGTPAGGNFYGMGMDGFDFDPSLAGIGFFNIRYEYENSNGCISSVQSVVQVDACVGIIENEKAQVSRVYPNPAGNILNVDLVSAVDGNFNIEICDLSGRNLLEAEYPLSTGLNSFSLDTKNLSSGTYLLKVNGTSARQLFQVIR